MTDGPTKESFIAHLEQANARMEASMVEYRGETGRFTEKEMAVLESWYKDLLQMNLDLIEFVKAFETDEEMHKHFEGKS